MQRKFFGNLLFLLFLNLLVKPFWILGIDRAVQNHVGYNAYGEYFALFNFSFLLNIFLDLGLTNYNNRNVAQSSVMFHKYLGTMLRLKFVLAIVYALLTLGLGFALGYDAGAFKIMGILAFNQFLISFILFLRSNLSGLFMFKADSIISVLDRLILIATVGFLLLYNNGALLTVKTFILSQSAAYAIVAIVLLVILYRVREKNTNKIRRTFSYAMVKQSLPFALLVLLMAMYTKVDAVMLERILPNGKYFTGIYAQSYRLLEALNMIAFLFSTLLLPTFAKMLKSGDSVAELSLSASKMLGVFSFGAAVFGIIYTGNIITVMYPDATPLSYQVLPVLLLCIIPISGTYVFGTLLTAAGNLRWLNYMAGGGLILNLILNFVLIPKYNVMGAVYATVVTQLATFIIQLVISKNYHKITNVFKVYLKLLIVCVPIYAVHTLLLSNLNLLLSFIINALVFVVLCLLFKLLDVKYFVQLLRSRQQAV